MEGGGLSSEDEAALLQQLPPGFRFHPTDEEIIMHYLLNKVMDRRFRATAIAEADLNKCEPWDLPKKNVWEKEWYLFFQRDKKYPTGMRTNRATESGYWKATGKDKEIKSKKNDHAFGAAVVGMKKTLVFYKGRAPRGEKTNWVMHEYRLNADAQFPNHHNNNNNFISRAAKEEFVVCRVFQKNSTPSAAAAAAAAGGGGYDKQLSTHDYSFLQLDCPARLPPLTNVDQFPTSMPLTFSHQEQPLFGYQSTDDRENSRVVAPQILEHFSSNNSGVSRSQETRLCTEYYQLANEITSLPSKGDIDDHQLEGFSFSTDISDLDSLWSY